MDSRTWQIAAVIVAGVILVGVPLGGALSGDDASFGEVSAELAVESAEDDANAPAGDDGGSADDPATGGADEEGEDGDAGTEGDHADDDPATGDGAEGGASGRSDDLETFVAEAATFVEETRGLPFLEEPVVIALPDDEFEAALDENLEAFFTDEPELVEEFTVLYRGLRLIDADETIDDEYRAFGSAGVLGFYDPETDELKVREAADGLSLLTRATIVHELTHALDDQHFDLDRPEYDDRTDEIGWTFAAVFEGSAMFVENAWKATLSSADQRAVEIEEQSFGDPSAFDEFTIAFLVSEVSVYWEGEPFVQSLVDAGGVAALDAALTTPPATSEQIIERAPDEAPIDVPLPPADGEVVASGSGGQALVQALLYEMLPPNALAVAAAGWGGDNLVAWRDGDRSCVRWDIVADSPADLTELRDAFDTWAGLSSGASASVSDAGVLRVDSCE